MATLRSRDIPRLREAYACLVTPLDYPDTVAWRTAVCHAVARATGTERTAVLLNAPDRPGMVAIGWDEPPLGAYVSSFHHNNSLDRRRLALGLLAWARGRVAPPPEFSRSEYYNEWCAPNRHLDSAGMRAPLGGSSSEEALLYLSSDTPQRFAPDGREVQILAFLQPAFVAGARTALLGPRLRQDWSNAFDALPNPAILIGVSGRIIHATPAARALLAAEPDQTPLLNYARSWAREFAQPDQLPPRVCNRLTGRTGAYTIRATLLHVGPLVGCEPAVLFTIETAGRPRPTGIEALRVRCRLTQRECQVAGLLGQGLSNREVATRLEISEHTARRHAEHLFAKLGVRRRAEVAALIAGLADQKGQ